MMPDFRPSSLSPSAREARGGVFRTTLDRRMLNQRVLGGILAATLLAAVYHQSDPFEQVALPGMALLVGTLLAVLTFTRLPLVQVQVMGLIGGWIYLLGKIGYVLFALPDDTGLRMLMGLAPWMAVMLASHLWTLGVRASAPLNLAALSGLGALMLVRFAQDPASVQGNVMGTLLQMLIAGGVMLVGQRSAALRLTGDVRRAVLGEDQPGRDALTGLPERHLLEQQLIAAHRRLPEHLVVAAISVDRPADLPDAFAARLTAHVTRTLMNTVRDQDLLGCLGDDQMALVMRAPDARSARAACERLRVRVASRPLDGVNPTVTIGLVYADGQLDALGLLRAAEDTLAAVQRDGANRVLLGPVRPEPAAEPGLLGALPA
ncbi:diguanylate cyclase domain-containing protein [Deinococcus sedimenti]|uniref:GGDEF domain-containing protein n=1 Tax=Deinococcus sedimenti TaxID=1867090 RepID=A0ABQ2S3Q0_9DEIO|nr:diguanylate cyclase [Deinococcus sedimenti]GGR94801.1 hypothetical protein GCM10008960_22200 [Deinococcus sedimenti]